MVSNSLDDPVINMWSYAPCGVGDKIDDFFSTKIYFYRGNLFGVCGVGNDSERRVVLCALRRSMRDTGVAGRRALNERDAFPFKVITKFVTNTSFAKSSAKSRGWSMWLETLLGYIHT